MEIDPATADWTLFADLTVVMAAADGVPQAIAEANRRGLSY